MNRIGIFAGVFDPIHLGHTFFIKQAAKENKLDKVYILIEREPKYKTCLASYNSRKKMVELAIKTIPRAKIYESPTKYFPITASWPDIKKANPGSDLFLMLGNDVAGHINEWQDSKKLLKETKLIITERGKDEPYSDTSSLKIRRKLKKGDKNTELDPLVLKYCRENKLYSDIGE